MKALKVLWALPVLSMFTAYAMADDGPYRGNVQHRFEASVDRIQDRQHRRIQQGIASGELTPKEVRRLRKQQRQLTKLEWKFSRDGYLSDRERSALHRELHAVSDRIYVLKHNRRSRDFGREGERYCDDGFKYQGHSRYPIRRSLARRYD